METVCEHLMCQTCLVNALHTSDTPSCPTCSTCFVSKSDVKPASPLVKGLLKVLVIACDNDSCPVRATLGELRSHLVHCMHTRSVTVLPAASSSLPTSQPPTPLTPSKISLRSVLKSSLDQPPSDVKIRAATHLVKRIIQTQDLQGGEHLKLPTGGQVGVNNYCILFL